MDTIINNLIKAQEQQDANTVLAALYEEQKQTQTTLDNVMHAVEQGLVNSTTGKRMKELEDKLTELEKQILIERSKTKNKKLSKEEIAKYYVHALELEPKLLINYLVDHIMLYNDKMEITFNNPLNDNQGTNIGSFAL